MKQMILSLLLATGLSAVAAAGPAWVETYGTTTPYSKITHITGFSSVDKDQQGARQAAIDQALADLSRKIQIRIQAELVQREFETQNGYRSSLSSVTRSSIDTTVSNADFLFHEERRNLSCLAYVSIQSLKDLYSREAAAAWAAIRTAVEEAEGLTVRGQSDEALRLLYAVSVEFPKLYEQWSLFASVNRISSDQEFFRPLEGASEMEDIQRTEGEYERLIRRVASKDAASLEEGLNKTALILAMQGVPAETLTIPPLLFEATSFSSEFGRYAADRLSSLWGGGSSGSSQPVVLKGQYWEEDDKIRLIFLAVDGEGKKIGKTDVLIPASSASGWDLKPQNFDQAMIALREFSEGALTDGGIHIDVWTNKGNDQDALVFTGGETLQLYFRVNQPAFLQITYRLATGELVLLEPSFYIGSDRVNRTVPLPYEFEVQPPFGVEQLIVTAYSQQPPRASTVPERIEGELYDVFPSVEDVVVNTRGLGRKSTDQGEVRVAEAILNMTMIASP